VKRWLRDNPWVWIALFYVVLVSGGVATFIIAELNRPEMVPH